MDSVKGLIVGIIAGICLFFAFQTKVLYPKWVLATWDHPWIIVSFFIIAVYIAQWSVEASALLILCLAALVIDKLVFGRQPIQLPKDSSEVEPLYEHGTYEHGTYGHSTYELNGPPVADETIVGHNYPTFYGLDEAQIGPAPF